MQLRLAHFSCRRYIRDIFSGSASGLLLCVPEQGAHDQWSAAFGLSPQKLGRVAQITNELPREHWRFVLITEDAFALLVPVTALEVGRHLLVTVQL